MTEKTTAEIMARATGSVGATYTVIAAATGEIDHHESWYRDTDTTEEDE